MVKESKTISFFREIAKIPRESGHEEKIAEYLCEFAKQRNLYYKEDEWHNVLIKKKTCEKSAIILQAHTDMVCEKKNDRKFDFSVDSIELLEEERFSKSKWNYFRCR